MNNKVSLTINGREITAKAGTTILQAALQRGIYIPHLCHHAELEPVGACRLCLVRINDQWDAISCKTEVKEGWVVETETEEINRTRRIALELLIADHDTDCLACAKNTSCKLQQAADYIGVNRKNLARLKKRERLLPIDESNPFFDFNPNRCVACGICIRTCDEIQSVHAIDFAYRGLATKVAGFGDKNRILSDCESCGECVVRCPVGALTEKDYVKPSHWVKTVCAYCGCGCGLMLGVRNNKVVAARGERGNPANDGKLCVKGRFGYKYINSKERLTKPLIRRKEGFVEAGWDEVLELIADRFRQTRGEQFAAISSAKCTNEENYLLQKFTRTVMNTNNIDHCARL